MTLSVDLYWSYRSPYCYLASERVREMQRRFDLDFVIRVVYPLAIRDRDFFKRINPLAVPYVRRDVIRLSQMLGMPMAEPNPDPIVADLQKGEIADEQPYIHRISHLGVEAARRGRGLAFACEVASMIWGGVADWHKDEQLGPAAERAGLALESLQAAIEADPGGYDKEIRQNQESLHEAGHWGVPTFVFEGEPFFGQDRIDVLHWRLDQHGLRERDD